jgi:hypothetical protein
MTSCVCSLRRLGHVRWRLRLLDWHGLRLAGRFLLEPRQMLMLSRNLQLPMIGSIESLQVPQLLLRFIVATRVPIQGREHQAGIQIVLIRGKDLLQQRLGLEPMSPQVFRLSLLKQVVKSATELLHCIRKPSQRTPDSDAPKTCGE